MQKIFTIMFLRNWYVENDIDIKTSSNDVKANSNSKIYESFEDILNEKILFVK